MVNLRRVIVRCLVCVVLILIAYSSSLNLLLVPLLIVISSIIFAKSCEEKLMYFCFFAPMCGNIWTIPNVNISIYTLIRLVTIISFLLQYFFKRQKFNIKTVIWIIFFGIYLFIGSLSNGGTEFLLVINLIITYTMIFLILTYCSINSFENYTIILSLSIVVTSLMSYFSIYIPRLNSLVQSMVLTTNESDVAGIVRFTGMAYDPNLYATYALVCIAALLVLIIEKKLQKMMYIFMAVILSIFGIMSLSKMFFLGFIVIITIFVSYIIFKSRTSGMRKLIFLCVLIIIGVLFFNGYQEQFSMIAARFDRAFEGNNIDVAELTTKRSEIWIAYLKDLEDPFNLFLGVGIGGKKPSSSTPHNLVLHCLYLMGVLGSMIYTMMVYSIYRTAKYNSKFKKNRKKWIKFLPLLSLILTAFSVDLFLSYDMLLYMIPLCFMCTYSDQLKENHECVNIQKDRNIICESL